MTPDGLFHPACATCSCWNGHLCELISDFCDDAKYWHPSVEFMDENPGVRSMVIQEAQQMENVHAQKVELRRLRISQLRRMVHSIQGVIDRNLISAETEDEFYRKKRRRNDRFCRFAKACLAEIERLRGEG